MILLITGEPESDIPGSLFPKHVQVVQIVDTRIIVFYTTYLHNLHLVGFGWKEIEFDKGKKKLKRLLIIVTQEGFFSAIRWF